ncbi:MAG TPA: hypothetical protein ENI96_11265 [Sedimenticola thiotaurini]|uniref:Lipoprotein n=1 Tax=Sedimenticola thiotaurini TaxID=1543721 RepID=A0A831W9J4_9GAMM|nr:hypothetical protein [Sedimenticola thiotaurini]
MKPKIATGAKAAVAALSLPLLAACVSTGTQPGVVGGSLPRSDGFLTASVAPGRSASCAGTPCNIHYRTPDLAGDVTVVANGQTVGTFPPGTVVNLGDYAETTVRITVPGADVKPAYVNMPNDNR